MDARGGHSSRPTLRRITRACDFCHRRGLKCIPPPTAAAARFSETDSEDCLTCVKYGQQCTRLRQPKKRGTKPRGNRSTGQSKAHECSQGTAAEPFSDHGCEKDPGSTARWIASLELPSSSHGLGIPASGSFQSRQNIEALMDIYLDSIYPLYPFFCETELLSWWRTGALTPDRNYYNSVVAMCALSAHQAEKGALFTSELPWRPEKPLADALLQEAQRLIPLDYGTGDDINLLRSYGLLALIGTQTGDLDMLHRHLGLYQGLAARMEFHNEERWPASLSLCEKETRRRIFWVMYRLEVHNACVLGHPIRTPESQTLVGYPCGVHHLPLPPGRNGKFENWFAGWNFTTELYRILEHAIIDFRIKRTAQTTVLWSKSPSKTEPILQQLAVMQSNLMPHFAQAAMKSSDSGSNRCGFQVANILCTIHLVKMVAFASEDARFGDACQTAQDLVASMGTVPRDYVRAFGTPLMQELFGVGHMLASVTGRDLCEAEHLRLRVVLLSMADFIESLGDCIDSAASAAFRLRHSLSRIDHAVSRTIQDSPKSVDSQMSPSWIQQTELGYSMHSTMPTVDLFGYDHLDELTLLSL